MEKIAFRFNEGCQSYLYDCYILPDGFKPIKFFEDAFFSEVICRLSFLVDPQNSDSLDDAKLAEHLLKIAQCKDYTFTVPVSDVKDFLNFLIPKNVVNVEFPKEVGVWETLIFK